jgi:Lsr2
MPLAGCPQESGRARLPAKSGPMAQKVNVLLIDDIDGSDAGETVSFGLDGTHYEIDLNSDHAQGLRGQLQRYVKAARKVTGSAGRSARVRRATENDVRNKEIHSWAREQHLDVNDRGRIPAEIVAQYEAANGN